MSDGLPSRLFADFDSGGPAAAGNEEVLIWERLLENGTRDDLHAWLVNRDAEQLATWLALRGDRLSARSWSFWTWLIDIDLPRREANPWWPDAESGSAGARS